VFAKLLNQELFAIVEKRVIDGGPADIDSGDDWFRKASLWTLILALENFSVPTGSGLL
jgi:hypothetical protein